jgi:antitoxin component YwqK of YwqJK toxin-antitoxin module
MGFRTNSLRRFHRPCLIIITLVLAVIPCKAIIESRVVEKYADGTPKREVTYHHQDKLEEKIYYPDGTVEVCKDYMWVSYPWGFWTRYDKKGVAIETGSFLINHKDNAYENDFVFHKKNEKYQENYPNGNLKLRTTFKNGMIYGDFVLFYENGQLHYKANLKNGRTPEYILDYFENDTMRVHIFKNGKCDYINIFNEKGFLISQRISDPEPYLVRNYREDGRMKREILYKEGFEEFRSRTYGEDGYCIPENQYNYSISLSPCVPQLTGLGKLASFRFLYLFNVHTDKIGNVVSTEKLETSTTQRASKFVDLSGFQDCMKHWRLFPDKTYTVTLSFGTSEMNKNKIWIKDDKGFDFVLSLSPVCQK